MKYILFISITFNYLLLASTQVVLGNYSNPQSAVEVKEEIDKIIADDFRFENFINKKNLKTKIEESGDYYIVAIGPITDVVTKRAILNRVKKTKFKDAYLVNIKEVVDVNESAEADENSSNIENSLNEIEPELDVIVDETAKAIVSTTINEFKVQTKHRDTNIFDKYYYEIILAITIFFLFIFYLIIKGRKATPNEYEDLKLKTKDNIVQIEKTETIPTSITSNVVKKEVPVHDKITKKDFEDFEGSRIMIAEDNIINQKVMSGLLSDSNIDIVIVDDGQEVLDFLEKDSNFSIILMDAHMPNVDGYEATKRIRANSKYSHITIIALSGNTSTDDINKMKKVGMQDHLEKPLKMDALYDILYSYSRKQEQYEELEQALYIKDGLEICGGNPKFYKEILGDFIKDNADSTNEIKKLLNAKEFDKAQEFLLDMMGVAGNIGANKIQELADELRKSLDTYKDNKYLDLFKTYSKNYKKLEKEVKEYI